MTIPVLLADDQGPLRATFRRPLESAPDIEVVGASTGEEAVARARTARSDVVLMDIRRPGMDRIQATPRITADEAPAGAGRPDRAEPARAQGHGPRRRRPVQRRDRAQIVYFDCETAPCTPGRTP